MDEKIVLIGGESHTSKFISEFLVSDGYDYTAVRDGYSALNVIRETHPGVVLIDYGFRGENIIELVQEIKEIGPETVVVVFSSSASIKAAVEAIKAGAFDFVPKPLSPEQLKLVVDNALNTSEKCKVQKRHYALVQETYILDRIVGKSQVMQNIFRKILKVAKSNANVLISGESGTGKELVARSIHSRSPRSHSAFIPMDCGALPETLLEAGLFGHERGSFTGAISTKRGLFELAHKGTLFLDEITELSMNLQAKLLRVLQEQEFRRVGGSKNIRVDVRVISATNIDPEQAL